MTFKALSEFVGISDETGNYRAQVTSDQALLVSPVAGGTEQNVNLTEVSGVAVVPGTAPVPVGFYNPTGGALLDPTLPAEVVGNVADNGVNTGNPVLTGAVYEGSLSTYSSGDRSTIHTDSRGNLRALIVGNTTTGADGVLNTNLSSAQINTSDAGTARLLVVAEHAFNGTSWDRLRLAGSALGLLTEAGPYSYSRNTADGQVKGSAGFIHTISISPLTATPTAGLLTVYDGTTESGAVVYTEWVSATAVGHTVTLDVPCATGIYVGFDGALTNVAVTVSYR